MWSSSFNLPSSAAHATQVFRIAIFGVFKIGLLGDAIALSRGVGPQAPHEGEMVEKMLTAL